MSTAFRNGDPEPLSIEKLRDYCHCTFNGGHLGDATALKAFHHGMDTVCNVLKEWQWTPRAAPAPVGEPTLKEQTRVAQLENTVRNLRDALEFYADPDYGWALTEHADVFEESRRIVTDGASLAPEGGQDN